MPSEQRGWIARAIAWIMALKPVRVWLHFTERRGLLLAGGLSYQSLFAVFAGIWVGFATGGLVLQANPQLADAFFTLLATSVPGLIAWQGAEGVIQPEQLLQLKVLGITGAIAAGALAFTALGWLSSARDAVRALFDLPGQKLNFFLLKLKDLGLGLGFGAVLLVSAALSVFSTQATGAVLDWVGIRSDSLIANAVGSAAGLLIMLALDTGVLAALFRVLSGLVIPLRRLLFGSLLGGIGLGVLKVLGSLLLGGASRNPLLASFAILIGLLIWFNLVCTVILVTSSWIAVGMADDGLVADPVVAAQREAEEQRERERIARELERERERRGNWFTRLWHRR